MIQDKQVNTLSEKEGPCAAPPKQATPLISPCLKTGVLRDGGDNDTGKKQSLFGLDLDSGPIGTGSTNSGEDNEVQEVLFSRA